MSSEDIRRALADADGPDFYLATLAVYEETAQIRVLIEAIRTLNATQLELLELHADDADEWWAGLSVREQASICGDDMPDSGEGRE